MTRVADLLMSASVNLGLSLLFLTLYSFFRKQRFNRYVYFPRKVIDDRDTFPSSTRMSGSGSFNNRTKGRSHTLHFPSPEFLLPSVEWIFSPWKENEDDLVEHEGLDAVVLLRFIKLSLKIFVVCGVIGVGILMPINLSEGTKSSDVTDKSVMRSNLESLTLGNIPAGSNKLWAHFCAVYIISYATCHLLFKEYGNMADLRLRFQRTRRWDPQHFVVLVRRIPIRSNDDTDSLVGSYFQRQHPFTYHSHQLVYKTEEIQEMADHREQIKRKIASLQLRMSESSSLHGGKRPTHRIGFLGIFGRKVDTLDYYNQLLESVDRHIVAKQFEIMQDKDSITSNAFVVFKSRWGASVAAQTQLSSDPLYWMTVTAPEPRDVCWNNLDIDPVHQMPLRKACVAGIVGVLLFFYFIPVTFVQGLVELRNLRRWLPYTKLLDQPIATEIISGFLPALILNAAFCVLPAILFMLTQFEGFYSYSKIERATSAKVVAFYVLNIFFASVVSGSVLSELSRFIDHPKSIPERLGIAIPGKATFFVTYIMLSGWTGFSYEILRLGPLAQFYIFRVFFAKSSLDLDHAVDSQPLPYYRVFPELLLFILVGLVYSIIAPIVIPFLLVYFVIAYGVYRNQIVNVYKPAYESGGMFWPQLHNRIIAVLILMQLTMLGVFGLKESPMKAPLMLPLPLLTLYFNKFCSDRFLPIFTKTSLECATVWDSLNSIPPLLSNGTGVPDLQLCCDAYRNPAMQPIAEAGGQSDQGADSAADLHGDDMGVVCITNGRYYKAISSSR